MQSNEIVVNRGSKTAVSHQKSASQAQDNCRKHLHDPFLAAFLMKQDNRGLCIALHQKRVRPQCEHIITTLSVFYKRTLR